MSEAPPAEDTSKIQDELDALNAKITKQGAAVRQLKKDGAGADDIKDAVAVSSSGVWVTIAMSRSLLAV